MERYSRLYQIPRTGGEAAPRELGRSEGLDIFMRQAGIMNLQDGFDAVERDLAGFRQLSDDSDLSAQERPMLIRYSPIELAGRPGWASDVQPFLALCGSGIAEDGSLFHHTCFFRTGLLLNDGAYHYLDHLFGTRFADPEALDQAPEQVEPDLRPEDALTVKLAAAALLQSWPILLKLEKGCDFNRRAMDLLSQIYSLIPPALAVRTGFSSYQDPRQVEELLHRTPIRIFLTHADCACNDADPRYLYFDLNRPVNLQTTAQQNKGFVVSKNLFTYITYWHSMPWRERQPLMKLLFGDDREFNEQSYCNATRNFVREPFIQWINRLPDRETYTTLEQLKETYDNFPLCGRVPILQEKFCLTVPQLLKPPLTLDALGGDLRLRLDRTPKESEEFARLQELSGFYRLLQAARTASQIRSARDHQAEPDRNAAELAAIREAHAVQLQELEHSFAEQLDQLREENRTMREDWERENAVRTMREQELTWKLYETEQAHAEQLDRLQSERRIQREEWEQERAVREQDAARMLREKEQSLHEDHVREREKLEQELTWKLYDTERTYKVQLEQLREENQKLRLDAELRAAQPQGPGTSASAEKAVPSAPAAEQTARLRSEIETLQTKLRLSHEKLVQLIGERDEVTKELEQLRSRRQPETDSLRTAYEESMARKDRELRMLRNQIAEMASLHSLELQEAEAKVLKSRADADKANEAIRLQEQIHNEELIELEGKLKANLAKAHDALRSMIEKRDMEQEAHEAEVIRLNRKHEQELAEAKAKYLADIDRANAAVRELTQIPAAASAEAEARYLADIDQANAAIRALQQEKEQELEQEKRRYQYEIAQVNRIVREQLQANTEELEHMTARCRELEQQLEAARSRGEAPQESKRGSWWRR